MARRITLLALLFMSLHSARLSAQAVSYADIPKTGFAFARLGIGAGAPHCVRAALDFVAKGRHEFSIGYAGMSRKSPSVPKNAEESNDLINIPIMTHAQETMEGLTLGYAYILYPKKSPVKNRYVFRASVLLGARNDVSKAELRSFAGNTNRYTYSFASYGATALLFEPGMELVVGRGFGWGFSPYAVFNDHMCGAGMSISMLIGYVSNCRHPHKHSDYWDLL